jgi:D-serine deaminase-like pyridoxal phosphate-dependent protein
MESGLPATPAVVVDRVKLEANLRRVQGIADAAGVRLRPHVKTHKSVGIARRQVSLGAVGLTCAKPDEALVFVEAGFPSVTLAFPVIEAGRLDRLLAAAASRGAEIRTIADHGTGVAALAEAARRHGVELPVFLKVDVGLHRIGVDPQAPEALEVAQAIRREPGLSFRGLLAHAGHAYAAGSRDEAAAVGEAERRCLLGLADRLAGAGVEVPEISVGSTPTVLAQDDFAGITEIRPGNYAFLDLTAVRLGVATPDQVALTVHATVVGCTERHAIVDAGSKVLSSDQGPHGVTGVAGYGRAWPAGEPPEGPGLLVEKLSEEHGFVRLDGRPIARGTRLVILPNHSCVVVNLADRLVADGGPAGPETWPVDARGRVR